MANTDAFNLTDLEESTKACYALGGFDYGSAEDADIQILKTFLQQSKGTKAKDSELLKDVPLGTPVYRIYLGTAFILFGLNPIGKRSLLKSAQGVVWMMPSDFEPALNMQLAAQKGMDGDLHVSPSWQIDNIQRDRMAPGKPKAGLTGITSH